MPTNDIPPPKPKAKKVGPAKAGLSANVQKHSADKAVESLTKQLANAKSKAEAARVAEKLVKEQPVLVDMGKIGDLTPTAQAYLEEVKDNVIFEPNPGPQTDFLSASEKEVLFGGARGGGKSYALLADPLRYVHNKNHSALLIRRTMPELRDLIHKSKDLYQRAFPKARWRDSEKEWTFPSGARIKFGYCESLDDTMQFQGQEFNWIGIDEAGQYPDEQILSRLKGSLRSRDPELPTHIRMSANPGGPGQWWLKKNYVDPAPWNTRFTETVKVNTPKGEITEYITKKFIPSTVYDNPHLLHDNSYITMLASLPEVQRKQWLEGSWDVCENSAFAEFDRNIHVIEPFPIPHNWTKFRGADWGYSSPACVLWLAVDFDNKLYVYREYYTTGKLADEFANTVLDMELGEDIRYGVLDASAWQNRGNPGPSIAEVMTKVGCRWRPSDRTDGSRVHGKLEVHRRLAIGEDGTPGLRIFNTCRNLIRTLPALPLDKNNVEDVDTKAEDHAYDALRYAVMSRPVNPSTLMTYDIRNPTRTGAEYAVDEVFGY